MDYLARGLYNEKVECMGEGPNKLTSDLEVVWVNDDQSEILPEVC